MEGEAIVDVREGHQGRRSQWANQAMAGPLSKSVVGLVWRATPIPLHLHISGTVAITMGNEVVQVIREELHVQLDV